MSSSKPSIILTACNNALTFSKFSFQPQRSRVPFDRSDENDGADNVDDLTSEEDVPDELDRLARHAGGREKGEQEAIRQSLSQAWERRADEHDEYESQRAAHEMMSGGYGATGRRARLGRLQKHIAARVRGRNARLGARTDGSGRSSLGPPSFMRGSGGSYSEDPGEGGEERSLYDVEGEDDNGGDDDFDPRSFHHRLPGSDRRHRAYGRRPRSTADAALGGRTLLARPPINPYSSKRVGGTNPPGTPPPRRSWNPNRVGNSSSLMSSWSGAGVLGSGPSSDAPGMQNLGNTCYLSAR